MTRPQSKRSARKSSRKKPASRSGAQPRKPSARNLDYGQYEPRILLSVNDPPVNFVPQEAFTTVNLPVAFTAYRDNQISTSDPDAGQNPVEVTLTAQHGTVTLVYPDPNNGLNYTSGDGNADVTMTFVGKLDDLNAALEWVSFNPDIDYVGSEASLTITTNDQGYFGSGGPQQDTDTISITVNPVTFQDSPVWTTLPAALDTSFDDDGKMALSLSEGVDRIHYMNRLPNGKILAVGAINGHFGLMRFNADMTLDESFGAGGFTETNLGDGNHALTFEIDRQDRIVVGGEKYLARYLPDGLLDPTFGDGGVTENPVFHKAFSIDIQANGKIAIAGGDDSHQDDLFQAIRLDADGIHEPDFETRIDMGLHQYKNDKARGISVRDDGQIILSGKSYNFYTSTGKNEHRFGHAKIPIQGKVSEGTSLDGEYVFKVGDEVGQGNPGPWNQVRSTLTLPDGGWLLVGHINGQCGLTKHLHSGDLDPAFGEGGIVRFDFDNIGSFSFGAVLQSDGKIVISGYTEDGGPRMTVTRFTQTGELDPSFNSTGKLVIPAFETGDTLLIQEDGKIVIAGRAGDDIGLVRLYGDNNLFDEADYGDAPVPYPTHDADGGARHYPVGPRLGDSIDAEADGQPSNNADGDGLDEDGLVTINPTVRAGHLNESLTINVQRAPEGAKLDGWIDFNRDGNWGGPGEHLFASLDVVNGNNVLEFDVPSWASPGTTYARFRVSTYGQLGIGGSADDGEVEDWVLTIESASDQPVVFGDAITIGLDQVEPEALFSGDIDGDGDMDLVVGSRDGQLVWYENMNGIGTTLVEHTISNDPWVAGDVRLADIDGDGDLDVVGASEPEGAVFWYDNQDGLGGSFEKHLITTGLQAVGQLNVSDVDGDGDYDVVAVSSHDDTIAWHENVAGDGSEFVSHLITQAVDGPRGVATADMDGDGDLDILGASIYSDTGFWLENVGGAGESFQYHLIAANADRAHRIEPVDMDGDGDMDAVLASRNDDTVAWYENVNGDGTSFVKHVVNDAADGANTVRVADLDGDGDHDLLVTSIHDNTVSWYENVDGVGGEFSQHDISSQVAYPTDAFFTDIDGDGVLDVATAGFNSNSIVWFKNYGHLPPVIDPIADATIAEDSGQNSLALTGIGAGGAEVQSLHVTASNDNPALFSSLLVDYQSPNPNGFLLITPNDDLSGTAVITVTVEDGGLDDDLDTPMDNLTVSRTFTVTVTPVNDAPLMDKISDVTINEDAPQQIVNVSGVDAGGGESQHLRVTAISDNPILIPDPAVDYNSPDSTGTVRFTPLPDQFGTAVITVTVEDGGDDNDLNTPDDNLTISESFTVTVNPVNDAPSLDPINDLVIVEDSGPHTIDLTGIDAGGGEVQFLAVNAQTSDPGLITTQIISSGQLTGTLTDGLFAHYSLDNTAEDSSRNNRHGTMSDPDLITPATDRFGNPNSAFEIQPRASIDVLPEDSLFPYQNSGVVTYSLWLKTTSDRTMAMNQYSHGDVPNSHFYFSVHSDELILTGNGTNAFRPAYTSYVDTWHHYVISFEGVTGDVQVWADGNDLGTGNVTLNPASSSNMPFRIGFLPNAAGNPVESRIFVDDVSVFERSLTPDEINQLRTRATLQLSPQVDQFGDAVISVTVEDGGDDNDLHTPDDNLTTTESFTVTVSPVNDAPLLDPVADRSIDEDSGQHAIELTGILAGPGGESQNLRLTAHSNNQHVIPDPVVDYQSPDSDGYLRLAPLPDQHGATVITVIVEDGGEDNDLNTPGDNLTSTQTFTVVVQAVNDPPRIDPIGTVGEFGLDSSFGGDGLATHTLPKWVDWYGALIADDGSTILAGRYGNPTFGDQFIIAKLDIDGQLDAAFGTEGGYSLTEFETSGSALNLIQDSAGRFLVYGYLGNDGAPGSGVVRFLPNGTLDTAFGSGGMATWSDGITYANRMAELPDGSYVVGSGGPLEDCRYHWLTETGVLEEATVYPGTGNLVVGIFANGDGSVSAISRNSNDLGFVQIEIDAARQLRSFQINSFDGTATDAMRTGTGEYYVTFAESMGTTNQQGFVTKALASGVLDTSFGENGFVLLTQSEDGKNQLTHRVAVDSQGNAIVTVWAKNGEKASPYFVSANGDSKSELELPAGLQGGRAVGIDNENYLVVPFGNSSSPDGREFNVVRWKPSFYELSVQEDDSEQIIELSGIQAGPSDETEPLRITATSDNPDLIPTPAVDYTSPSPTGTLRFTPAADQFGTALITVTVEDGGDDNDLNTPGDNLTYSRSFQVTVQPVNDDPLLDPINDVTIENVPDLQTVDLTGIGAGPGGETQNLRVTAVSDQPGLIPDPTVEYSSPDSQGRVRFSPVTDQYGDAQITVTVEDGGDDNDLNTSDDNLTFSQTFTVTVTQVEDLGPIDYYRDEEVTVEGQLWFEASTHQSGYLSVLAQFEADGSDGDLVIELLDEQKQWLATAESVPGGLRVDYLADVGESFYVKLAGVQAGIDLRMVNLVKAFGSSVNVSGTTGDDPYTLATGSQHRVVVHGVDYSFSRASYPDLYFDGGPGTDSIWLGGTSAAEMVEMRVGNTVVQGSQYTAQVFNFEDVTFVGRGGSDSATFHDTNQADTFSSAETWSKLTGDGYYHIVRGLPNVTAKATTGYDVAFMLDTAGNDSYETFSDRVVMTSDHHVATAIGFKRSSGTSSAGNDTVTAYDSNGDDRLISYHDRVILFDGSHTHAAIDFGSNRVVSSGQAGDVAYMFDAAGDDQVVMRPESTVITQSDRQTTAEGFRQTFVYASDGNDTVEFHDTAGDNDYNGYLDRGVMKGDGIFLWGRGFDQLTGHFSGGTDRALMFDSPGDDTYVADSDEATISHESAANRVLGFDSIFAFSEGGHDTATLYDTAGEESFRAYPDRAILLGDERFSWVGGFGQVTGHSSGGTDIAYLYDSVGDDTFRSEGASAQMSGGGFLNQAVGFLKNYGYSSGGNDLALMYDTPGNDLYRTYPEEVIMNGQGIINAAYRFRQTRGYSTAGSDAVRMFDSAGDDEVWSYSDWLEMIGDGWDNEGFGFDRNTVYGSNGFDQATMEDSSGNDLVKVREIGPRLDQGDGTVFDVRTFDRILARSVNGGDDFADLLDVDYEFELEGDWNS